MPVRKFKRIEDMPELWFERGDPRLFKAIAGVWNFGQRWLAPHYPPGVYKHRSLEEKNRHDEEWAAANFQAFREKHKGT
jgi:hypothetical protein